MSAFKTDGTFTSAAVMGGPRRTFPFERDTTAYIEEQDYVVLMANFARTALGTAHPTLTTAFLVQETDLENLGAGLVKWTRRFATVPAIRSEYESFAAVFPAVFDAIGSVDYRYTPLAVKVTARTEFAYFNVGTDPLYPTVAAIPVVQRWAPKFSVSIDIEVDFVNPGTVPTVSQYLALVAAGSEIAVEDSIVRPWLGNIYERETRYVVAR